MRLNRYLHRRGALWRAWGLRYYGRLFFQVDRHREHRTMILVLCCLRLDFLFRWAQSAPFFLPFHKYVLFCNMSSSIWCRLCRHHFLQDQHTSLPVCIMLSTPPSIQAHTFCSSLIHYYEKWTSAISTIIRIPTTTCGMGTLAF